jgi:arsenical pump membrane protein
MLVQRILAAAGQAWPPFVLVAGLLLIGSVAATDELFEAIGTRLARAPLQPRALLLALLGLVAVVTAVLNVDTSVVFLTPVLVHAARGRGLDERPFLYGSVFMANSASLLLPGSNLTNLLVLRHDSISGAAFALDMLPAWLIACALTAAFLTLAYRLQDGDHDERRPPPLRLGLGAAATLTAATLMLILPNAALPVLALGLAATALRRLRPRLDLRALALLFALAVGLGTLARIWDGPARLLASSGQWATAVIAGFGSVLVNNLPAAVLFSAQPPPHPRALLIGLDLGPNLAVTGSLSAFLWLQAARTVNADTSIATYTKLGALLVPLTLAGTLAALALHSPHAI